ncbi:glutaredoxin [Mitosporidium daphniae]
MFELSSKDDVENALNDDATSYLLIVFYSADNAPCCNLITIIENWESIIQSSLPCSPISFSKVNAEKNSELCEIYALSSLPTVVLLSKNQCTAPISMIEGYDPLTLANELNDKCHIGVPLKEHILHRDMLHKIDTLVKKSPIMLFIKGSPDAPRCGFTRKLLGLLSEFGISSDIYGYFDILSDEAVRQGLKIYSDWPTYPQIFVHGEFVGGLDIVSELLSQPSVLDKFKKVNK